MAKNFLKKRNKLRLVMEEKFNLLNKLPSKSILVFSRLDYNVTLCISKPGQRKIPG